MLKLPFIAQLEESRRVLIAGAGGGYDVFCGLPLYFALVEAGKEVHLANLSFSMLPHGQDRIGPDLVRATALTPLTNPYFPEVYLSRWFREHEGKDVPVYCFERTGVVPLTAAYRQLVKLTDADTILLIDGGTDSLMRGDESGLGTPEEDAASLTAVSELEVPRKILASLGFGVDYHHGVCHAHFLEAAAELTREGAFLGSFSLLLNMPEVAKYRAAAQYVFRSMPKAQSIVSSSILPSLEGAFGDHHATERTHGSKLWINPLMSAYWCFELNKVAERLLYRDLLLTTERFSQVTQVINNFREELPRVRSAYPMPL